MIDVANKVSPAVMRLTIRSFLRPLLNPWIPVKLQRRLVDVVGLVSRVPAGTHRAPAMLGDRPAERITVGGDEPARTVLYLHGGGYTVGSLRTHRPIAAHLAEAANAEVYMLDYRRAPEAPYPSAVDDTVAAYHSLLDQGVDPNLLVIAGDSAGGGLAIAALLRLRDDGRALPAGALLISPWLDLTLSDTTDIDNDPMLQLSWLKQCAKSYVGPHDPGPYDPRPHDPGSLPSELAPLHADLHGLPPLFIHVGTDEILLHDSERMADRARDAGVDVEFTVLQGLWHVIHLNAGLVAESTAAVTEAGKFVRRVTGG